MRAPGASALRALLRAWPARPWNPAPMGDEALGFVRAAVRHGLAGFVQHAVEQVEWTLPEEARALLRREAWTSAARAMRVKALLLRSVDALSGVGVVPVLLKGYGLAQRLYPEPLLRATSDVDLLVARHEVESSVRALTALGLSVREDMGARHVEEDAHHLELAGDAGLVELHFRALAPWGQTLEGDELAARAADGEMEGRRVRWLRPEDEAVYLSLHASNHLLQRLAWVFDLKLLARAHPSLDWDAVVRGARDTGLPRGVWYGWEAAARMLDAPVPSRVLEALAPPRWQRELAGQVFSDARLLTADLEQHKSRWFAAKLLLAPRPGPMARYALRRLGSLLRSRLRRARSA